MPYIIAENHDQLRDYARRLLDAANDPAEVETDTSQGGALAFRVSDELARKAGFSVTDDDSGSGESDGETVEAPARNASRDTWAQFLDAQDPPITYTAGATRNDLVDAWEAHQAGQQQ